MVACKENWLSELLLLVKKWENKTLEPWVCFLLPAFDKRLQESDNLQKDVEFESRIEREMQEIQISQSSQSQDCG